MRRREFIAGLGGAAVWPLPARAQQPDRARRVGCVYSYSFAGNDPIAQARVAVFREGLAQLGWTERNVRIEERFAGGDADQMQAYAAELVGLDRMSLSPTQPPSLRR
jgi:putative ABC transport system substrate-binding protein